VRILHLEDQKADAELVKREFARAGLAVEIRAASSEAGFRDELAKRSPDVILSDFSMPGFDGLLALSLARELCPDVPFIFVSGTIGEEHAILALKHGATDYVLKTNLVRLPPAVERALRDGLERAQLREAERALEQSDAALRRAQLMAGLAHVITGADGAFESWSETLREMIGVEVAAMPRSTREWLEFVHPEDRARFRANVIDANRSGARVELEYRLRHAGGSWIHVKQVSEPLDSRAGAPGNPRWFGTLQDVTQQKRAEDDLRRFKLALDNSADIIFIIDRATMRHVDANAAASRLLGYTREELLTLGPQDMLPFSRSALEKTYDDLIANPSRRGGMRSYYRCKDGSQLPFESTRHVLRSGDSWLVAVISRDIRDRLASETELRESEARFRSLIELSSDFYWETDAEHRMLNLRHGTDHRPIVGVGQIGKRRWESPSTRPDAAGWAAHRATLDARQPFRDFELARIDPTGVERHLSLSGEPVFDAGGVFKGYRGIGKDITRREQVAEALRESEERFRSLGKLSSDWFWQTDAEHRFMDTPARVTEITGLRANAYVGKRRWEVEGLLPVSGSWDMHRALLERRETYRDLELVQERPGGSRTYLQISGEPVNDRAGNFIGYRGTAKDITERKGQQEKIGRLTRVYAVLSGINSMIVRVRDRDELFRETCRIAVELGKLRLAYVGLIDIEAQLIRTVASAGDDPKFAQRDRPLGTSGAGVRQGGASRALHSRRPVINNDIRADAKDMSYPEEALKRGYRSSASLPLIVGDSAIGVIGLWAGETGYFDAEEMKLLTELAGNIAFALDHLGKAERLRVETAERSRAEAGVARLNRVYAVLSGINAVIVRVRTREELFAEACRIAVENGQFRMAWLGIVDRAQMQVRPVAWQGVGEDYIRLMPLGLADTGIEGQGLAGRAVMERKSIAVDDMTQDSRVLLRKEALERGFRSLVMLPLIVAEEAVGVLALYASEVGFFDAEEMKLLHELAGDIAFALDHIEKASKLDYLAYYDALTGLANRSLLLERLAQRMRMAGPDGGKLALVVADIERLRTVNESLGRQAGDAVIRELAARLSRVADSSELARTSADHFVIVLPLVKGRSEAARRAERALHECLMEPFQVEQTELRIAARAGIALFPNDGIDAETLLRNAEAALRKAKDSGERHHFYTPALTERTAEQLSLENRLRQALEKEEFVLHYQPKVDIETRRIVGIEGLIRWQSPELGLVPPGKFIPLMEDTGLILEAGSWALRRAAVDHRNWVEQKLRAPRVAVNVSAIQLRQRGFVGEVEQAIMEGVAPTGIDLEITESLLMEDVEANIRKLKEVRGLGVSIAIDDFGTGYSSLSYLAKLPVQTLKVDRSFIVAMLTDADTMTLVQTIISLAHSLRLKVVAEGVELEEQAKILRLLRCDEMQGYLFSRPVPFAEMTEMLKKERPAG
jgi:diguanylate cyclase (GGDEF)-like protein/PAS domain S-box-containing protein